MCVFLSRPFARPLKKVPLLYYVGSCPLMYILTYLLKKIQSTTADLHAPKPRSSYLQNIAENYLVERTSHLFPPPSPIMLVIAIYRASVASKHKKS